MRLAAPVVIALVAFVSTTSVQAQNRPAPAPTSSSGAGSSVSRTYQSEHPKQSYRVEPVDGQSVRVGGWVSSGFTVEVNAVPSDPAPAAIDTTPGRARRAQSRTRVTSEGSATSTTARPLRVDLVEMEFVEGRIYLTLTNPRQNP